MICTVREEDGIMREAIIVRTIPALIITDEIGIITVAKTNLRVMIMTIGYHAMTVIEMISALITVSSNPVRMTGLTRLLNAEMPNGLGQTVQIRINSPETIGNRRLSARTKAEKACPNAETMTLPNNPVLRSVQTNSRRNRAEAVSRLSQERRNSGTHLNAQVKGKAAEDGEIEVYLPSLTDVRNTE